MTGKTERWLRIAAGSLLWALAGIVTISLYWQLAGDDLWLRGLMVLLAIGLETSKVLCWRSGETRQRLLALLLAGISIFAGFSASLQLVSELHRHDEVIQKAEITDSEKYHLAQINVENLDRQIEVSVERLATLPPDFVTAAARLQRTILDLREQRAAAHRQLSEATEVPTSTTEVSLAVFVALEHATGVPETVWEIAVLVSLATAVEFGGLFLAGSNGNKGRQTWAFLRKPGFGKGDHSPQSAEGSAPHFAAVPRAVPQAEDYLRVVERLRASGHSAGYRRVRQVLGCSEPVARRLLAELVSSGRIERFRRGGDKGNKGRIFSATLDKVHR